MRGPISTSSDNVSAYNLELFFNLSPDLLCIAGYDGYFKKINPTVSKTLGYTTEELYSRPIDSFVHPDDRELTSKKRENIKKNHALMNFENRYLTKGGEIIWLSWTSMPIKAEKVVFAIAKNVTHRKKLEEDRNTLLRNLTDINNDLKRLAYSTSHDLRLPVSNLLSVFNMLDSSKIHDEETLEFIDLLKVSTEGLKDTLNNYIDALNNKHILIRQPEKVNIGECLAAAVHSLQSLILSSGATISTDFSEFNEINFNRAHLESIFLNLITNSVKYARLGIPAVITVRTRVHLGVKELIFADEGQGFDMDAVKDKIFGFSQRFTTQTDSKGIGLYLVHNYIESAGGKITVASRKNEGACFTISFKK